MKDFGVNARGGFRVEGDRFMGGARDVPRVGFCTCGWNTRTPNLHAMNRAIATHMEEGTEGCDHAVDIECDYIESSILDDKERH